MEGVAEGSWEAALELEEIDGEGDLWWDGRDGSPSAEAAKRFGGGGESWDASD